MNIFLALTAWLYTLWTLLILNKLQIKVQNIFIADIIFVILLWKFKLKVQQMYWTVNDV